MKKLIAAAALTACLPAAPAAEAEATAWGYAVSVFDLTPGDSFEAGCTQLTGGYGRYIDAMDGPYTRDDPCRSGDWGCYRSRTTGAGAFDRATAAVIGPEFEIAPYTAVVVSAVGYAYAAVGAPGEEASAGVSLEAGWDPGTGGYGYASDSILVDGTGWGYPNETQRAMSVSFANVSDQPAWFFYMTTFNYSVSSMNAVAPVPEPSTYALMAVGLMAVGLAVRRRRTGMATSPRTEPR